MLPQIPNWTSPQTFGDPQLFFFVVIVILLGGAAAFGIFTVVRELRGLRRRP